MRYVINLHFDDFFLPGLYKKKSVEKFASDDTFHPNTMYWLF